MINFKEINTNEEIQTLAKLANDIWKEYWPCLLSEEQINFMVEKFQSYNSIKSQIEKEKYIYKIIEHKKNIAGYFGVCPKENCLFLSKLYIIKDFRNLGIGKTAFEEIKNIAKLNNKNSIILTVNKYNTNTIKAYKKWGFIEIDAVVTDIGNGFVMDDYIMEYKV